MAIRSVRIWPDPALSQQAQPVAEVTQQTRALIADLFDTMYAENGIGLAANQIGVPLRVLVIDLDPKNYAADDKEIKAELDSWGYAGPRAFVNPEIVAAEGDIVWEEGCLSVPGITDDVKRKERVEVRARDADGKAFGLTMRGLYAVAIQHEIDHLDGKVFVEYLSRLKRDGIKRKMLRLKSQEADSSKATRSTPRTKSI